jgi:hypothetical protein
MAVGLPMNDAGGRLEGVGERKTLESLRSSLLEEAAASTGSDHLVDRL